MMEEIHSDEHFFSVDPLTPLFNFIEISVSFSLLDPVLDFVSGLRTIEISTYIN